MVPVRFSFFVQVDGAYAAVKFPTKENAQGAGESGEDIQTLLQDVRLVRKDELQVSVTHCRLDFTQKKRKFGLMAKQTNVCP